MFAFGAVSDDMAFEFDPVSESSDEIEPQSEMGGFPGMGGEEDGAGGPDLPHAGRGGEVGDKPPRLPESRHRRQRRCMTASLFTIPPAMKSYGVPPKLGRNT